MDDVTSNKIDSIIADIRKHADTLEDYKRKKLNDELDYLSDAIGYMLNYIWAEKDNMDELIESVASLGEEYGN